MVGQLDGKKAELDRGKRNEKAAKLAFKRERARANCVRPMLFI